MKRVMKWSALGLLAILVIGLGFVTLGFLAPLKVHYIVTRDAAPTEPYGPDLAGRPFVGLALSGGGTRAALFGAAGMEALARRGVLDDVTHVSSVSGGGFPAAYLAMNPVPVCDDDQPDCLSAYFAQMRTAVSRNYMGTIHVTQFRKPWRLLQPSRRLSSLHEILARPNFLGDARFEDITDARAFYFNTVSYDTGQRFVFSNAVLPFYQTEGANLLPPSLRALSFSQDGAPQPTPRLFPLSLAVATSAAFPPYLGPLSIEREQAEGEPPLYRRLGDGGILENSGVETLAEAFLAHPDPASAVIYAFNAGLPLDAAASQRNRDLSIFSFNLPQFVDVLLTYARAHREAHITEFARARDIAIDVISFDYLDVAGIVHRGSGEAVEHWLSWEDWADCPVPARRAATPVERLRVIPTSLSITACDASLITQAAEFVVDTCLAAPAVAGCFEGRR